MTISSPPPATVPRPTVPPEFTIQQNGRTFVLYAGLLSLVHQVGLRSIEVELVQTPAAENQHTAICRARVETATGVFTELGDANAGNVTRLVAAHLIRMAATRAKARALRDAVNVGMTAIEELGGDGDETGAAPPPAPAPAPPPAGPAPEGPERIRIGERAYTREEVWSGYQARRTAALNAKVIETSDPLAGHVPTDPLRDLVASAQRLRKRLEPPPELDGAVEEAPG